MVAVNNWKRLGLPLIIVLAMLAIFALSLNGFTAANASSADVSSIGTAAGVDTIEGADVAFTASNGEKTTYIVVLNDAPLARYNGDVAGYAATSRQATGAASFDVRSADSVNYLAYLAGQRTAAIKSASNSIGRGLDVQYEYGATLVGFAAEMTAEEALSVQALDQVAFVELEKMSYPQTDSGPIWAGASDVWGGDWNGLSYEASLSGANEVPPVSSTVTGGADFSYNFYTNELSYTVSVENPDNVEITAMHIHSGTTGTNGGVIYNFSIATSTTSFTETGSATLSDAEEAALVNGNLYVNVHSSVNGSGEVRGQIGLSGSLGAGVVVGIIDTGIDPWNPSFASVGGDGYVHTNPLGDGTYLGVCDPANAGGDGVVGYDATFPCNSKLIGVWGYTASDTSPRDTDGHGSHTGGTSAGNIVFDSVVEAPTEVFTSDISGVAPHANIIAYDGCSDGGGCPGAALAAARDQALMDGVDVINYSIGSSAPTGDLWGDSEAMQWLALREAGVFVATSNGNAGNGDATTGSPSDLPWITSVGASSHNRSFLVSLTFTDSVSMSLEVRGQAMTSGYGPAEIIFSDTYTDSEDTRLCAPGAFAPGTFSGEIVICERGEYGRVAKGQSVLDGGAGGFILAQPSEETGGPGSVAADTHALPAIHIDYYEYQILRTFMLTNSVGTVNGTLSGATLDSNDMHGDIMATFSSRGPNGSDGDLIVPNVTAPGRAIWAAYHQGDGGDEDYTYNVIQGTSMSSPHVAGAGALLRALNPSWTPAEMESALMMTARDTVLDDDGATVASPFAQGAGHIDIAKAINSPLVMDVTNAEYLAADPSEDNDFYVRDLNIASMGEDACVSTCSWSRTVKNVSSETLTWTLSFNDAMSVTGSVSPTMFSLAPGESQKLDVTVDVSGVVVDDEWRYGSLMLDEMSDEYPDAHLPYAVLPSTGNLPETLSIETQEISGTVEMKNLVSLEITDLQVEMVGLVKADRTEFTIVEDNDTSADFPDIFFDAITTTQFVSIEVPAGSFSVIAEIVETQSPDLDMLLFLDADDNGPDLADAGDPAENPYACQSASGGSAESCEILDPMAGTYYVAIINFSQVTPGGDWVDLATAVVEDGGANEGNMVISGPSMVAAEEPYTLTVDYNDPSMTAIDKLYGYFTVGSSAGNEGDIATVRVDLTYLGIPDIAIDPEALAVTRSGSPDAVTQTLTLSTTGGVLEWNVNKVSGVEAVQDGSFEEGYADNPYWNAGATGAGSVLPICAPTTCGPALAFTGDWYVWMGGLAPQTAYVTQTITIDANAQAQLSYNLLMGGPMTATAMMTVSLDGNVLKTYSSADVGNYGTYPSEAIDVSSYADGGEHVLAFDFHNPGADNFNMFIDDVSVVSSVASSCSVEGDISWLDISPSSGTLSPGAIDLTASFSSVGLAAGTYTDTLCVNSNDPDEPILNVPVAMTVTGSAGTGVGADGPTGQDIFTSDTATFSVVVENTGNVLDTFDITLSGNAWSTTASPTSVSVDAGMTTTVEIMVSVPSTATLGASDMVTVTATGQDSGSTDSIVLTTRVKAYTLFNPIIMKNGSR
ncbi:MAG: S8 family serine peptidase [Anaerolineae bacterium]